MSPESLAALIDSITDQLEAQQGSEVHYVEGLRASLASARRRDVSQDVELLREKLRRSPRIGRRQPSRRLRPLKLEAFASPSCSSTGAA